jgi:hypothetical protein
VHRYALTILCCAVAGGAIVLGLDALDMPFWVYPAGLTSLVFVASRVSRRRVGLTEGRVMRARNPSASWERQRPLVAATVVAVLTGVVVSIFLYVNAPGASLMSVLGFAFGFGILLGFGTLRAIVAQRSPR